MKQKIQLPAIHDKDLRKVLDKFGLSNLIDDGKANCHSCSKQITFDNLYGLKVLNQNIIIFCDEPECIDKSSK
ncbi:hypothetical protein [Rufibacter roseus]|uniref:Uncharacterized protein n=1 Tax=Rufibacter roseus TaxID=1567108 RepID=A0ABW2DU11_9BACT|nr:hypothetical protein [Rufibacter roseus]